MVRVCDVVTINAPLHAETEHLFDDALIAKMKRGAYIVNTARGKIYAVGLGATGLTFYDDDVTEFLAPGTSLSPMLCAAVGVDARRPR